MKKLSVYFLVLASFIVTSCNEFMEERNTNPNEVETICAKIKGFEYDTDDFSRTFISIEQDGPHYAWAVTDTIGIFPSEGRQVEFSMASGAGSASAVFTGGGWGLKSTSTYAAYFPLIGQYYLDKTDIPVHYTGQVQEGDASTAHLGVYDYLAAPASEVKNGGVSFDFERLGCLVQIQLTVPSPTTIYSVTLKAENEAFAVKGKVDLTESSPRIYPVASSSEIMLEVKNVTTAKANQVATFYMMLPPTDLSGKTLKAVVSVENGSKEVSLASKNFQAGKAYALSATLGDDWISETDYVDLKFGMTGVATSYNTGNGSLSITYPSGSLPNVKVGNATVLPAEYGFDIRVIESVNTSGNTISMQTSQGNMSNLFRNTSFTLTTDASATRSAEDNVYTPTAYGYVDEAGKYHEVYNIENGTRAVYPIEQFKWGFERDYKGEVIYSGKAGKLSWDECKFSAGLKGTFTFDFGMKQISEVRAVGDLKKIEYKITGNMDMDMLLHYNYEYEYKESGDEIIQYNAIPMGQFTFRVPIGGVPVPVHLQIYTHLGRMYACHIEGKLDATAGVKMSNEVSIGLEWTPENGVKPIREIKPTFEFHPLTVEAEASAEAKVSYYPQWEIGLYRFKAVWLEPRPYLKEKVEAGFRASTDGNNYIGWKAETYNGMDIRIGLETEFGFWRKDVWTSDIYNCIKDRLLFEAPAKITTLSPKDGITVKEGENINAEFIVESFSPITNKYYPCPFALVNFSKEYGELDRTTTITDITGKANTKWNLSLDRNSSSGTKTTETIRRVLAAKVVDKEGTSIDEAYLTVLEKQSEEKPKPRAITGNASNIETTSAIVQCSYENVSNEVECGVEIIGNNLSNKIIANSSNNSQQIKLTGLTAGTSYEYKAYVKYDGNILYGETKSFTTKEADKPTPGEMIDLGLSVKWASHNVGASSPEGFGGYYAWGETEEKSYYESNTYKYYQNGSYVNIGNNISGTQYDVAHVKWGGSWRMPTLDEIIELVNKCSWKWTTYNGVKGQLVTGPNGNSIFLPAAGVRQLASVYYVGDYGRCLSATPNESNSASVYGLDFLSGGDLWYSWGGRSHGYSVRPVSD